MVGKLEVALRYRSRRGRYAAAFGIGKVGGLAVALNEVEAFVKLAEVEVNLFLYGLVNFFDEGAGLANEQDFSCGWASNWSTSHSIFCSKEV